MPRVTHSLVEPAVIPENGEVSVLATSSMALCTVPLWAEGCASCGADAPVEVPVTSFCWWVEALLVCSRAKIAKDTTTMRHTIREAKAQRCREGNEHRATRAGVVTRPRSPAPGDVAASASSCRDVETVAIGLD